MMTRRKKITVGLLLVGLYPFSFYSLTRPVNVMWSVGPQSQPDEARPSVVLYWSNQPTLNRVMHWFYWPIHTWLRRAGMAEGVEDWQALGLSDGREVEYHLQAGLRLFGYAFFAFVVWVLAFGSAIGIKRSRPAR